MALPGETTCRPVASCGQGTWGDIPVDATTQYVDPSYTGGASDGSASAPWISLDAALAAASTGDLIALATGTYPAAIQQQCVRIWGRCPSMVELTEKDANSAIMTLVIAGCGGAEMHGVSVAAGAGGLLSGGNAGDVLIDQVWVKGAPGVALRLWNTTKPAPTLTVRRSLFEGVKFCAIWSFGTDLVVEDSVFRDTAPSGPGPTIYSGRAIQLMTHPQRGEASRGTVRSVVVERTEEGAVFMHGAQATIDGLVVRDVRPNAGRGRALTVQLAIEATPPIRPSVTVRSSYIEAATEIGVSVSGGDLVIEDSVVKGTRTNPDTGEAGVGVVAVPFVLPNGNTTAEPEPASLTVASSWLERNHDVGIAVVGGTALVTGSVVTGTLPQDDDTGGVGVLLQGDEPGLMSAELRASLVDASHSVGVSIDGADAVIDSTLVRGTLSQASSGRFGTGIQIIEHGTTLQPSRVALAYDAIEGNRYAGVMVSRSHTSLSYTAIKDTLPVELDLSAGYGLAVFGPTSEAPAQAAEVTVDACSLQNNHAVGLLASGAEATITDSVILDTSPRSSDGHLGRPLQAQNDVMTRLGATLDMRTSTIRGGYEHGVMLIDSSGQIAATRIENIARAPGDELFGDGAVAIASEGIAALTLLGNVIQRADRAAVGSFGATVRLQTCALDCAAIYLNGETSGGLPFAFEDMGGNACGCDGVEETCRVASSNIAPPSVLGEPPVVPDPTDPPTDP